MNCSFSKEHYIECLQLAKDNDYSFIKVKDYARKHIDDYDKNGIMLFNTIIENDDKKVILMRHDVDFSLEYAYELANIEYDLNVNSSYYVYLHSELYNALSPKSMGMIKAMKNMGHEIGLHTEGTNYLEVVEHELLNAKSWTFHLPGLKNELLISYLVNPQRDIPIKYISDSGRNWREGCMCKHIGKIDKLHILVHPEWWCSEGLTREDAVHKLWQSNLQTLVRNMTDIKQMLVDYVRDDLKQ